jgi:hypothetical protein
MILLRIIETVQHNDQGSLVGLRAPVQVRCQNEARHQRDFQVSALDDGKWPARPELRYVGLAGQQISLQLGGVIALYRRDFSRRKSASTAKPIRHDGDQQKN